MTEDEYVIATNRVRITLAIGLLRDTLPGENFGVDDTDRSDIMVKLCAMEEKLFSMIDIAIE